MASMSFEFLSLQLIQFSPVLEYNYHGIAELLGLLKYNWLDMPNLFTHLRTMQFKNK